MRQLILASSSPYRRQLLDKLGLRYQAISPDIDESPQASESASELVMRLALEKAQAIANDYPDALIIGSDQVAMIGEEILSKPGKHETALKQLQKASGNIATFHTGLCLLDSATKKYQCEDVIFKVFFRSLKDRQIENYLEREKPYDCAGSFKSEGLGISLFQKMEGDDPNSLIGLPIIKLIDMLNDFGVDVLA